jgi:hypothetical protein
MQVSQKVNKLKTFRGASARQRTAAALISLAVAGFLGGFWLAGHYSIDMGFWLGHCGFKQRYGLPCPTCGWTTAALTFAQGKILQAFYIQPAAAFMCSIMVVTAFVCFVIALFGVYFSFIDRLFAEVKIKHLILALIVIVAAGWAVTLSRALAGNTHP